MITLARSLKNLLAWHRRKMAQVAEVLPRGRTAAPYIAASVFASSCNNGELAISTDLSVQPPADVQIQQVQTMLRGVEFRRGDSDTELWEFTDSDPQDLLDYTAGRSLQLLTDEELPEGTYTGVRLLFDTEDADESFVIDGSGAQRELTINEGSYAPINIRVDEDDSVDESLMLTLDLRQSLSLDDEEDQYTLAPVLRAVSTEDAGQIQGTVTACVESAAVYLFEGEVEPDDIGAAGGGDLYLTAAVSAVDATYEFEFLPEGEYTLAVACDAEDDDPGSDDEIEFRETTTVDLEEGEELQEDL